MFYFNVCFKGVCWKVIKVLILIGLVRKGLFVLKFFYVIVVLNVLDFLYNKIGDSGVRVVGKLLNGWCNFIILNLCDNKIRLSGVVVVGYVLGKNIIFLNFDLRLNR